MDEPVFQESPFGQPSRRRSKAKRFLILIIAVLILFGVGFGAFSFFKGSSSPELSPTPIPTVIIFPSDTPTPEVSKTPTKAAATPTSAEKTSSIDKATGLDRAKLTVIVQNGSGKTGVANVAADELRKLGYAVTGTSNADNFNYENVTIQLKPAKSSYLSLLKKDLSISYTVVDASSTLASSSADAVVIIGK